jgi:hypothetical protein
MNKPIIIYSLARTKSSAVLQAAKREVLLHEPFDPWSVFKNYHELENSPNFTRIEINNQLLNTIDWQDLKSKMSSNNTAIKFFGAGLHHYYPAQKWFKNVTENDTHEIFVLLRNLEDTLWSHILALKFGHTKNSTQVKPYKFTATEPQMFSANLSIERFLDFYPKGKKIITFNALPLEYFDYSKITLKSQKSKDKRFLVTNYEFVNDQIHKILLNHKNRWEDITGTDIFTKW